jgi:hypothetical protein
MKPHDYSKLGASGFVDEDTEVGPGTVIIGRCMPQKQGHVIVNKDTSVSLKSNESGFIDRNCHGNRFFTNVTGDGYTFAKVGFGGRTSGIQGATTGDRQGTSRIRPCARGAQRRAALLPLDSGSPTHQRA